MPSHYNWLVDRLKQPFTNECTLWPFGKFKTGYGQIFVAGAPNQGNCYVHRVAYEIVNGAIPEGLLICHSCDIRDCFNPFHLFSGTNADNNADMTAKKRN